MAESTSGINQITTPDGDKIFTATKVTQDADGNTVTAEIIQYSDQKGSDAKVVATRGVDDLVPAYDAGSSDLVLENQQLINSVYRNQVVDAVKSLDTSTAAKEEVLDRLNSQLNHAGVDGETLPAGATVFSSISSDIEVIGDDEVNSSSELLRYPINQSSENYDFIKIQAFRYVPDINITRTQTTKKNKEGKITTSNQYGVELQGASRRITETVGPQIFLPMTPSISETNNVGWGEDRLNPIQRRFGAAAIGSINDIASGNFGNAIGKQIAAARELTGGAGLGPFISAYFAGQAVGANLLGRAGIVVNPNLELLFSGPKLRSFKYDFTFTPRDPREASEIREIIKVFKKTMAVKRAKGNLFLKPPDIYKIKYVFNGGEFNDEKEHPFLNKIKPCALTSFNVNYAPDGSYMTYQNGSMTSYQVSMVFDELEPIYSDDQDSRTATSTMGF